MLDFYGLFASYVAFFSCGVYMEIESLRLDLHLKRKQKKTTRAAPTCSSEKKEKKKKKKTRDSRAATWVAVRPGFSAQRTGLRRDLGRGATWVRRATWVAMQPGSTRAAYVAGLDLARPRSA